MFRHRADQESATKPKMAEAQPYAQVHRQKHNLATPTRAVSARFVTNMQGGRSCAGARVAPAEKFGLGQKF